MKRVYRRVLFLFTNDLRLDDNPALSRANEMAEGLLLVYATGDARAPEEKFGCEHIGIHRKRFLKECIDDLQYQLGGFQQSIVVEEETPYAVLKYYIETESIDAVVRSKLTSHRSTSYWARLKQAFDMVDFYEFDGSTLLDEKHVDSAPNHFVQFTPFKKFAETLTPVSPNDLNPILMAPFLPCPYPKRNLRSASVVGGKFIGGEKAATQHIKKYFASDTLHCYKKTRNSLDGWSNSTKLSAWLAAGCVSPRRVYQALKNAEAERGVNESTYWVFFELLWREFFHWHALYTGKTLFSLNGVRNKRVLSSFYPDRFKQWCEGSTPWPLVNAIMHELNETGYISNRGRQISASALVNDLRVDWRYGATYFQQQLIDYDESVNWGNWQYIAGVGCDPRGGRHFNIEKQQSIYDPEQRYIDAWEGHRQVLSMDSVDYVDWPIDALD